MPSCYRPLFALATRCISGVEGTTVRPCLPLLKKVTDYGSAPATPVIKDTRLRSLQAGVDIFKAQLAHTPKSLSALVGLPDHFTFSNLLDPLELQASLTKSVGRVRSHPPFTT